MYTLTMACLIYSESNKKKSLFFYSLRSAIFLTYISTPLNVAHISTAIPCWTPWREKKVFFHSSLFNISHPSSCHRHPSPQVLLFCAFPAASSVGVFSNSLRVSQPSLFPFEASSCTKQYVSHACCARVGRTADLLLAFLACVQYIIYDLFYSFFCSALPDHSLLSSSIGMWADGNTGIWRRKWSMVDSV